jgi:cation diffusion facilitator CzcD-associated flavoprotein CzcO
MVGAGISGIGAVKLFKETFPNRDVELVIYEKNADVTGTWLENRYPGFVTILSSFIPILPSYPCPLGCGSSLLTACPCNSCACDVPAHAYTYSWEGNPRWSRAYVGAVELYDYFKGRAVAYGVDDFVHLEHRVTSASWDDQLGKWIIQITDLRTGSKFADEGEILINAAGFLKYV